MSHVYSPACATTLSVTTGVNADAGSAAVTMDAPIQNAVNADKNFFIFIANVFLSK